jgi:hypothetical protein
LSCAALIALSRWSHFSSREANNSLLSRASRFLRSSSAVTARSRRVTSANAVAASERSLRAASRASLPSEEKEERSSASKKTRYATSYSRIFGSSLALTARSLCQVTTVSAVAASDRSLERLPAQACLLREKKRKGFDQRLALLVFDSLLTSFALFQH